MQTLREAFSATGVRFAYPSHVFDTEEKIRAFDKLLDLPILDGVGLVAMDMEAGAVELRHATDRLRDLDLANSDDPHTELVRECGKILTACGIIVPDEMVEIDEPLWPVSIPTKDGPTRLSSGDTIAVIRKSILHPQVNEEE